MNELVRVKRKPLKLLLATSALSFAFASSIYASSPVDDPFLNKDIGVLKSREESVITELNHLRSQLEMTPLTVDSALKNAAQSHSNYQLETNENTGHVQYLTDHPYFSGKYFYDRAKRYNYEGNAGGESIAPINISEKVSLQKMIDAPYHRIGILNPNHTEIGVGSNLEPNKRSMLVLTFGSKKRYDDSTPVMYPYHNQTNVPIGWYENERPNPLEKYGLTNIHTGYPISFHYGDADTERFDTKQAFIKDNEGNQVDYYLVDHTSNHGFQKHVILIPKEPLKPNTTYHVYLNGTRVLFNGETEDVSARWSFQTVKDLEIVEMGIRNNRFIPHYNAGDLKDVNLIIRKDGRTFHLYETKNGKSSTFATYNIEKGVYEYTLESPSFNTQKGYLIVKDNNVVEIVDEGIEKPTNPPSEEPETPNENGDREEPKDEEANKEKEDNEEDSDENVEDETEESKEEEKKGFPSDPARYKQINLEKPLKNTQRIEVSFTQAIARDTVNQDTVYVLNKDGETVPVDIKAIDKKIIISPAPTYESGSYTIIIENIEGAKNRLPLKTPVMITFTIK